MRTIARVFCGRTRSGKEINFSLLDSPSDQGTETIKIFDNIDDNFDAYALFQYLAYREKTSVGSDEFFSLYLLHSTQYLNALTVIINLNEYQQNLNVHNVEDLILFGRQLAAYR